MMKAFVVVLLIAVSAQAAVRRAPVRAVARGAARAVTVRAVETANGMAAGTIAVVKATWGGKDVTKLAADFCDGQLYCDYKVDSRFIGEPTKGTTFNLAWSCKGGALKTKVVENAEGTVIQLACPAPPSAMVEWTARSALNYPESFHSIVRHSKDFPGTDKYISDACLGALKEHIDKGGTFASPEFKRFFAPLSGMKSAESADLEFFHYTNVEAVKDVVAHQKISETLSYLRTNATSSEQWYMYVAGDPHSSARFGSIQVRLYFKPNATVFYAVDDGPAGLKIGARRVKDLIESTLITADPSLSVCAGEGYSTDRYQAVSILEALAAEAHGASLIAYYGVDNVSCPYADCGQNSYQWMELLGSWGVQRLALPLPKAN